MTGRSIRAAASGTGTLVPILHLARVYFDYTNKNQNKTIYGVRISDWAMGEI